MRAILIWFLELCHVFTEALFALFACKDHSKSVHGDNGLDATGTEKAEGTTGVEKRDKMNVLASHAVHFWVLSDFFKKAQRAIVPVTVVIPNADLRVQQVLAHGTTWTTLSRGTALVSTVHRLQDPTVLVSWHHGPSHEAGGG